ncbi:hypothetical protein WSK_2444 [Novosphingobium sp. Rr 2-17]|uniref:hypothetical protein n=1 Tax=Novosphingobium sp. Rr 2-17 TaxID=555793 RepID=UPI000269A838|nr:hypothetical protein [Novosphingobium sp. Rr 2-17]EIZ78901.1 hypothetical protein WSK_2444 [Novosphingobium sp. Rr 2-17]
MNDNRLLAVLALLVTAPAMIWALRDYRAGRARLMLGSRRSLRQVERADNPRKFWGYTAFNLIASGVVIVFAVLLFFKPPE